MGYEVGKTPVGRGQCAPPLGVQYVSAAAHMGAALQRNLQNMRRGGGSAPPDDERRIFTKMSFRGAKRRGNPYSPYGRVPCAGSADCHTSDIGHWFAMTFFGACGGQSAAAGRKIIFENFSAAILNKRQKTVRCKVKGHFTEESSGNTILGD